MIYQLVVQLSDVFYDDFDWLAKMEERLDESLVDAELDGHDIGSGEVNFFIHTNHPIDALNQVKHLFTEEHIDLAHIKVAYRAFSDDDYSPLWPDDLVDFQVI